MNKMNIYEPSLPPLFKLPPFPQPSPTPPTKPKASLQTLPLELLTLITTFASYGCLLKLSTVCTTFAPIAKEIVENARPIVKLCLARKMLGLGGCGDVQRGVGLFLNEEEDGDEDECFDGDKLSKIENSDGSKVGEDSEVDDSYFDIRFNPKRAMMLLRSLTGVDVDGSDDVAINHDSNDDGSDAIARLPRSPTIRSLSRQRRKSRSVSIPTFLDLSLTPTNNSENSEDALLPRLPRSPSVRSPKTHNQHQHQHQHHQQQRRHSRSRSITIPTLQNLTLANNDKSKAVPNIIKSLALSTLSAFYLLTTTPTSELTQESRTHGLALLTQSFEYGLNSAGERLCEIYEYGSNNIECDYVKLEYWLRRLCDREVVNCMVELGDFLEMAYPGTGEGRDYNALDYESGVKRVEGDNSPFYWYLKAGMESRRVVSWDEAAVLREDFCDDRDSDSDGCSDDDDRDSDNEEVDDPISSTVTLYNCSACYSLGTYYESGLNGCRVDYYEACVWYGRGIRSGEGDCLDGKRRLIGKGVWRVVRED